MVYSKKQWNIAEKQTVKFGTVYNDLTFREFRKLYKSQDRRALTWVNYCRGKIKNWRKDHPFHELDIFLTAEDPTLTTPKKLEEELDLENSLEEILGEQNNKKGIESLSRIERHIVDKAADILADRLAEKLKL